VKCKFIGVTVKSVKVKKKFYEDILTEVAEIVYSSLGLSEKSVSTVVGAWGLSPTILTLSQSDKKGSLR
jgi:hypothetical protein